MSEQTPALEHPGYNYKVVRQFAVMTVVWGVVGMLVGVLIAAQLAWPALNFDLPWLHFGRLRPLHTNAVIFAFGGCALFGTSYYVVQRTCQARLFSDRLAAASHNGHRSADEPEATPEAGPWRFTLDTPSYGPFLEHSRRRDLRETMYRAFVDSRTRAIPASDHVCSACPNVARLDLKVVVHRGPAVRQPVGAGSDLLGPAVTIAHRLLKNTVRSRIGASPYIFLTDAATTGLGLSDVGLAWNAF